MRLGLAACVGLATVLLLPAAQAAPPLGLGTRHAEGEYVAVSLFGDATARFAAASGTGGASCTSSCLALTLAGDARAGSCFLYCTGVAVSGLGHSHAGLVAASAGGDAHGLYAISGAGDSDACRVSASVGGDARACDSSYCDPSPFSACGKNTAISVFGDAEGDIAVSLTGRAEGSTASLSGCRLVGTCTPEPAPGGPPAPGP